MTKPLSQLTLEDPEVWLPVVGWEGFYEVSSHGRVRSVARTVTRAGHPFPVKGKLLAIRRTRNLTTADYPQFSVCLCHGSRRQHAFVPRLVCEAFHGPAPEGKPFVLHGPIHDQAVNYPANLRWGDHVENMADRRAEGYDRRPRIRRVEQIRALIAKGMRTCQIARTLGIGTNHVSLVRNRDRKREEGETCSMAAE